MASLREWQTSLKATNKNYIRTKKSALSIWKHSDKALLAFCKVVVKQDINKVKIEIGNNRKCQYVFEKYK